MASLLNIGRGLVGKKKGLLPSGYVQLEYIEAVGLTISTSPYINTGYYPNPNTFISVTFRTVQCNDLPIGGLVFGERIGYKNNMFWLVCPVNNKGNNGLYINSLDSQCGNFVNIIGKVQNFKYNSKDGSYSWNGGSVQTAPKIAQSHNLELYLFSFNENGSLKGLINGNIIDIFSLTIGEDDILIRNFIPCKNPNNVVGMYDTVNGVFYSSPNGIAFVAGHII